MKITAKLEGVAALKRNLEERKLRIRDGVRGAILRGGFKIERQAKAVCPYQTGRLRASLSTAWSWGGPARGKVSGKASAEEGVSKPTPDGSSGDVVHVGTNLVYGRRIEHGFFGPDSLGRVYAQEGQPYLFPSYFSLIDEIKKDAARALIGAVK